MGCQAYWYVCLIGGHPYISLYIHMPLICPCIPPYTSMFPYTSLCFPMSWGFWDASVHLSDISVSVSTSVCHQFIMVIPVAQHHCGSLLYWTGGLQMYAQLHAVDFSFLCSVFIISQASAVCSGTSSLLTPVTMAPFSIGLPATSGQHDVGLPPLLTLRNLSLKCLFRPMPIMPWVLYR